MSNISKAKNILTNGNYSCVAYSDLDTLTSKKRGVKPLIEWLERSINLENYYIADKVVGKGAAFLYIKLNTKNIYAFVISKPALTLLENNGINVEYDACVPFIKSRDGIGFCPIESAVLHTENTDEAIALIIKKLKNLTKEK